MVDVTETKFQRKKKCLELLTRFYKWLQDNRPDKNQLIIVIYSRLFTAVTLGKVLVSKPGPNFLIWLYNKHILKTHQKFEVQLSIFLSTILVSSSKTTHFSLSSISTVQPGPDAADALSSGQEKKCQSISSGLTQSSPITPTNYQQWTVFSWKVNQHNRHNNSLQRFRSSLSSVHKAINYKLPLALGGF